MKNETAKQNAQEDFIGDSKNSRGPLNFDFLAIDNSLTVGSLPDLYGKGALITRISGREGSPIVRIDFAQSALEHLPRVTFVPGLPIIIQITMFNYILITLFQYFFTIFKPHILIKI